MHDQVPDTIPRLFFHTAQKLGDQVAQRKKNFGIWHDITWNEYARQVRRAACGFMALGLEPGKCVSVIGENSPEWVWADLGCMAAGGVTVGVYTTNSAEECRYILDHSQSVIYVVENEEQLDKALEVRDQLPNLEKIVVWDTEGLRNFSDPMVISFDELLDLGTAYFRENPDALEKRLDQAKPDGLAILIYTSGTTGPPKGAMLSHHNVLWTTQTMMDVFEVTNKDEAISFLPLCHIAERMLSVFMPLRANYVVNFVESPDTVTQNMVEVSPTFMMSVPRIWEKYFSTIFIKMKDAAFIKKMVFGLAQKIGQRYANARLDTSRKGVPITTSFLFFLARVLVFKKLRERLGFERLRVVISGAAPISPDVLRFYHSIGIPLRQIYGQTEDTGPTSCHIGDLIEPDNTGPPLPGVQVKIADDGEILVKGPNVFLGYFRSPEATAETLVDGWLYSGDVGVLDDKGYLKITDRKKDLIITSGGKNIAPQNIENQLKFSPYINDAVVIGDRRKFVSALIVIDEDMVVKFAQDQKIQFTTFTSLTESPEVIKLIQGEVGQVNKTLARVEQIKKFRLIPKKLYEEDGEVTPTMKVKRKHINEKYGDLIKSMYKGGRG